MTDRQKRAAENRLKELEDQVAELRAWQQEAIKTLWQAGMRTAEQMRRAEKAEAAAKPWSGVFQVGDKVEKVGGDYTFPGPVVAAFCKLSGAQRYVVEDDRGVLHIFSDKNLRAVSGS